MSFLKDTRKKVVAAISSLALVVTGLLATNVTAQAAALPNVSCDTNAKIFDTAWNGSTGVLASGADRNWKVDAVINNTTTPYNPNNLSLNFTDAVVVAAPPAAWFIPTGTKYISEFADGSQLGTNTKGAPGYQSDIFYKFDFTLDNRVDPSQFTLSGNLFADNSIMNIWVNGVGQSSSLSGGTYTNLPAYPSGTDPYVYTGYAKATPTTIALTKNWVNGTNTLIVQLASGMNKEGFAGDFSYSAPCTSTTPVLGCSSNPNMFNTAWDGQYGRIASGTDSYWKVSAQYYAADTPALPPTTGYNSAVIVNTPPTPWAVLSNASWISQNSTATQVGSMTTSDPTYRSNFFYRYDFNLDGAVAPSSVSLVAKLYADNAITEVFVNDVPQSVAANGTVAGLPAGGADPYTYSAGYKSGSVTQVTLDKNWKAGANTLVIKLASGMNKEGIAATFIPTVNCPTPLPTPPAPIQIDKAVATCVAGTVSTVEITGSGFTANSTVKIDSLSATVVSQTATILVVNMPAGAAAGLLDVEVTDGGQSVTGGAFYSNACPNTPDPLAIVSAELNCENGAAISISVTGAGMTSNAVVTIDSVEATVISRTANTITVAVPDQLGTPPLDIVLTDGAQVATGQGLYTGTCPPPTPAPTITIVELVCDQLHPDTIRITGENFTDTTTVEIGGVSAEIVSLTGSTVILARIPAGLPTGLTDVSVIQGSQRADKLDAFYNGCVCVDPDGDFDWDSGEDGNESPKPKVDLNGDCNGYGWAFGCNNGNHYGYETTQSPDPGGDNDHTIVSNGEPTGSSNDGPNNGKAQSNGKMKRASISTIQTAYFSVIDVQITHASCPDPSEGVDEEPSESPSPRPTPTRTSSYGDDDSEHDGDHDDDYSDAVKCNSPAVPGEPSTEPSESPEPEKTEAPKVDLNGDCNGYGWAFGCNNGNHYGYETTQSPDPGGDNDHNVVSRGEPTGSDNKESAEPSASASATAEPSTEPSAEPTPDTAPVVDPKVAFPQPEAVVQFTPLAKAESKVAELISKLDQAQAKLTELRKAKAKPKAVSKVKSTVVKLKKQLTSAKKTLLKLSK